MADIGIEEQHVNHTGLTDLTSPPDESVAASGLDRQNSSHRARSVRRVVEREYRLEEVGEPRNFQTRTRDAATSSWREPHVAVKPSSLWWGLYSMGTGSGMPDAGRVRISESRMDEAVRRGFLEKRSQSCARWKPRLVVLQGEALMYSKSSDQQDSKSAPWVCIPIRSCLGLAGIFDDKRVFELRTTYRQYLWRAKSSSERDAWVLAIAKGLSALRETDLLHAAKQGIINDEFERASEHLDFLESLSYLEGALSFRETRSLILSFVSDYKQRIGNDGWPTDFSVEDVRMFIRQWYGQHDTKDEAWNPNRGVTDKSPYEFSEDFSTGNISESEGKNVDETNEAELLMTKSQQIRKWLQTVLFPDFLETPLVQKRIAELVAKWTNGWSSSGRF
eukprot:GHVQ01018680.1.p1 GENE.GHVQ01018680.1~~GHVQ01018680.1.p1  ORF type:complete len:391 (-),score=37.48 GHVQ01018680.1:2987-4159(-)